MVAIKEVDWNMNFDEKPGFAALESREEFGSFDWSLDDPEEPVQLAMMASADSYVDEKVLNCSTCKAYHKKILTDIKTERDNAIMARAEREGYKVTLESVEAKILVFEKNEEAWNRKYNEMEYKWKLSEWELEGANCKINKLTKERDSLKEKLDSWNKSGLSHVEFVEKQRASDVKTGL